MSSQNIDIEEPFIDETITEDYTTKGAFNAIYDLVINQSNDQANSRDPQAKTVTSFLPDELDFNKEVQPSLQSTLFSTNGSENAAEQTQSRLKMQKSRDIHRQLMNRKNRWKPSELELTILKLHFGKNKYPSKEDKEAILRNLEENFNSTIQIGQLNRWFQHEREKSLKNGYKGMSKNTYKKFGKDELDYLKENFTQNNYPKTEEMLIIAKKFEVSLSKIENWYKHNRRALARKGDFILKTKKYFKRDEVNYLLKKFSEYPRPTKEQILEMAQHLNCSELQIKNWYSNKRKKQKLMAKKQATESQEIQYHEAGTSLYPQVPPQSYDSFTNFQMNSFNPTAPNIPNTYSQGNETNGLLQNMIPMRSTNNFSQMQQLPGSYPAGVMANNQYFNGVGSNGSYPNGTIPVIVIPASSINQSQALNLGQNNNGFLQVQEPQQQQQASFFRSGLSKNMLSSNNPAMSPMNNAIPQSMGQGISSFSNLLPSYNPLKQNNFGSNNTDMPVGSWINQNPALQSQTPIMFISGNKQQAFQNPQMAFTMQNQPNNFASANINPNTFNTGNFIPASFNQNGCTTQGLASHETPMQIQYLTNLYCPYSNNNIFSTYYPVVYQNGSNFNMQSGGKPAFGMDPMTPNNMASAPQQMPNNIAQFGQGFFRDSENSNDQRFILNRNGKDSQSNKF